MPRPPARFPAMIRAAVMAAVLSALAGFLAAPDAARAQGAGKSDGESATQRLSQLEEQMVDLQVAIGTLQSLVTRGSSPAGPAGPGAAPVQGQGSWPGQGGGNGGGDSDLALRVNAMETQIAALTGQIEQLSQQIAQLQGQPGAPQQFEQQQFDSGSPQQPQFRQGSQDGQGAPSQTHGSAALMPWQTQSAASQQGAPQQAAQPQAPQLQFGQQAPSGDGGNDQLANLAAGDARQVYEDAYGHLVRRDYGAAEDGFRRFIETFPNDALAGNAQYWLGETYYVRGEYKQAADAFLESYRRYSGSNKAPDSLLKLGMSLNKLGQAQAACQTYSELSAKFPDAPDHVKQRIAAERGRAGC